MRERNSVVLPELKKFPTQLGWRAGDAWLRAVFIMFAMFILQSQKAFNKAEGNVHKIDTYAWFH